MSICIVERDLACFEARQAKDAAIEAAIEHECLLVRSVCSVDELESVARGAEIQVLEALVERLAERRISAAINEAARYAAASEYEGRENCF